MIEANRETLRKIRELAPAMGLAIDATWEQYHPDIRNCQTRLLYRGVPIDVMLPRDAHDRAACLRREQRAAGDLTIWVVRREDFILQKLKAGRPRDFDDAARAVRK